MQHTQSIDVVMLTKNSNKPWFRRVLNAIRREIPVHHFIVVDGYSVDGTVDVVREFFKDKILVVKTKAPLGCARYLGMKAVDTEWFAFIDSDVEILPGWFKVAQKYMHIPRIYGIQGVYRGDQQQVLPVLSPRSLNIKGVIIHGIVKLYGADTANVLLRRDVVNLIEPAYLCQLECGEDAYIAWKIIEVGFLYIKVGGMKAVHYVDPGLALTKTFKRSLGCNGIFYAIPFKAYMISCSLRFLSSLFKRKKHFAHYLLCLIGGPISWIKTKRLTKICRRGV